MSNYEIFTNDIIEGFRKLKGRAGAYIIKPVSPFYIILKLIIKFRKANPDKIISIICQDIDDANKIRNLVCKEGQYIKLDILTEKTVSTKYKYDYDLIITLNVENVDKLNHFINAKFYLFVFYNNILGNSKLNEFKKNINFITNYISPDKIIEDYINSPVEETLCPVYLSDEDRLKYDEYTKYITDSIKIFGNFDNIDKCRTGDKILNISNVTFCNKIAEDNGWNYQLDTSIPFNKDIDDLYNPNALFERAMQSYNIMRERKNLVNDNEAKFEAILDICKQNPFSKIIIVSARGEFANKIHDYLKDNNFRVDCYHNEIPDKLYFTDYGEPVLIKSGKDKGKQKIIGSQKQSTLAAEKYNEGNINILCIKASSDVNLAVDCDILINTTPLSTNIYDIKRRFIKTNFRANPAIVYTVYCQNTIESIKIDKLTYPITHSVIRDDENTFIIE